MKTKSTDQSRFNRLQRQMSAAGFTLIEVLIAAILTLLMMAALAKGFKIFTDGITEGRSRIAVIEKLRNVVALVRHDLESCTVRPAPPLEVFNGTGYFELYDGPFTDYTSSYFGFDRNALGTEMLAESRFGDPDDILMFTARSKATPFTGKVPMALLKAAENYRILVAQGTAVTNINQIGQGITADDWTTTAVIASEYAEIVYFLLPVPNAFTPDAQIVYDPTTGLPSFATTPSGFPKEYQLHRRVLLIRPDLNIVVNNLAPYLYSNGVSSSQVVAAPSNPADDRLMLAQAHQNCDLSIRRLRGNSMLVAANSLEDLKQRENRFAHWVRRAGGSNTTMPILALTDSIYNTRSDSPASPFSIGDPTAGTPPLGRTIAFASGTIPQYTGFMHPAFALGGDRLGEDVLATGLLAFDLKVFDPGVVCYYHPGIDGTWGTGANNNDAGNARSDDHLISPSDPGYPEVMLSGSNARVGYIGEFVDLAWGPKIYSLARRKGVALVNFPGPINPWVTPFSGYAASPTPNGLHPFTEALIKSGVIASANSSVAPSVYQPTFDTWSSTYETDDQLIRRFPGTDFTLWSGGSGYFGLDASGITPSPAAGRGANGFDDDGNGIIDDINEKETSPPFLSPLTGIKIEIRGEDPSTGVVQQMSVVHDFVSH